MTGKILLGSLLLLAAVAGCSTKGRAIDNELWTRQLREMEDDLYWMQDECDKTLSELESCRRENATLRKELEKRKGTLPSPPLGEAIPPGVSGPAKADAPSSLPLSLPVIEQGEPTVEPGTPATAPTSTPSLKAPASSKSAVDEPASAFQAGLAVPQFDSPASAVMEPTPAKLPGSESSGTPGSESLVETNKEKEPIQLVAAADDHVSHIVIDSRLSGGYDFDGEPGDEGLLVVVQPRNVTGAYVPQAGAVSIIATDPTQSGEDAAVARWDFTAAEAAERLKKNLIGRGIYIEMPWPNKPPKNTRLRVFVRYETADGRQLQAQRDVTVHLAGEESSRWTPASPRARLNRSAIVRDGKPVSPGAASPSAASSSGVVPASAEMPVEHGVLPAGTGKPPGWSPDR